VPIDQTGNPLTAGCEFAPGLAPALAARGTEQSARLSRNLRRNWRCERFTRALRSQRVNRFSSPSVPYLQALRGATALAVVVVALLSAVAGCSKGGCDGVELDGQCQRQCLDSLCQDDQRCVDNACSPACTSDDDCGTGRCERVTADHGARGRYCVAAPAPAPNADDSVTTDAEAPSATPCTTNAECADPEKQQSCIEGRCVTTCILHEHCRGVGACTGDATDSDGATVHYCAQESFEHGAGQYGSPCLNGNGDCDGASGFRCLSKGEGDLDGYCAKLGCEDDAACPAGFFCNRDISAGFIPCESACGLVGDSSAADCIPSERIGVGRDFRCGETGIELRSCRKRDFCSPCTSDADCRGLGNQLCAQDPSGQKICTVQCDPNGPSCPWGSATTCAVHDPTLGFATCAHRSGSCQGQGASCDPCVDDSDCPRGFCSLSSFTGEQFCVDRGDSCSCEPNADSCFGGGCPLTPGGLEMLCVPAQTNAAPSACFGSTVTAGDETAQLGCWPL
jgi:hypothetical protein